MVRGFYRYLIHRYRMWRSPTYRHMCVWREFADGIAAGVEAVERGERRGISSQELAFFEHVRNLNFPDPEEGDEFQF